MNKKRYKEGKMIIDEYFINDFNGTEAVLKFKPNLTRGSAGTTWNRMLKDVDFAKYKDSKHNKIKIATDVTHLQIMNQLKNWAFSDITHLIGLSAADIKNLPTSVKSCIQDYQETKKRATLTNGTIIETITFKVKFVSKIQAIRELNKHYGFYEVDEIVGDEENSVPLRQWVTTPAIGPKKDKKKKTKAKKLPEPKEGPKSQIGDYITFEKSEEE